MMIRQNRLPSTIGRPWGDSTRYAHLVWYSNESDRLTAHQRQILVERKAEGLAVSVISCWEVAKLVELGRLDLDRSVQEWIRQALIPSEIRLLDLTPQIAVASTQLPGQFHRDPADQIIVATARVYDVEVMTVDRRILKYEHVHTVENA